MGLPSTKEDIDQKITENLTPGVVARAARIQADPIGPHVLKSHVDRIHLEDKARNIAVAQGLKLWRARLESQGIRIGYFEEKERLRKEFDKRPIHKRI
ncbi:MAG TPA: hypothetical protein VHG29_08510 [Novosphingobium sp.]|nr:hypothetical protein [Novosphingobium sp.]